MKSFKLIFCFLFLAVCFSECKKYPEDDKRYFFRSPKHRLEPSNGIGYWEVESFFVDGVDSTSVYCHPACIIYHFGMRESWSTQGIGIDYYLEGKWHFSNWKKNIVIENLGGKKPLLVSPYDTSQEWEIQKLTKREFWIRTNYNNTEYYLKLKSY